jgi:sigma-E factor negative regulatory protein RseB
VLYKFFRQYRVKAILASLMLFGAAMVQASTCPGANEVALGWLDKMSRSVHQVNYHGVVTLQRGDDMQVMQVSHSVEHGTSSERLTQLTGQGAQVRRADHPLECIHPGHKLLRLGQDMQAGHCGIARHYRFSVGDGERVAGRRAVRISIEPLDMYRFGYVMELDRETGLLLKTKTVGRGEQVLEKFQFANLSYNEEMPEGAEVNVVHEAQHPHPEVPQASSGSVRGWGVRWVPPGFTLTDAPGGTVERRTYTDGLAVFSVFLEELDREIRSGEGVVRNGGTTSYTRGMRLAGQPVLVTVIGEVPVNTARMVADSVGWVQ